MYSALIAALTAINLQLYYLLEGIPPDYFIFKVVKTPIKTVYWIFTTTDCDANMFYNRVYR